MVRLGLVIAVVVFGCAFVSESISASEEHYPNHNGLLKHLAHHHRAGHRTEHETLHYRSHVTFTTPSPKTNVKEVTPVAKLSHVPPQTPLQQTQSQVRQQAIPQEPVVDALYLPTATLSSADSVGTNDAVVQLGQELAEMEQSRANMAQLEQTLTADSALLRQSISLERLSTSRHGRKAAVKQARRAAQLVKDTRGMLHDSRAGAMDEAKFMATESERATSAADALTAEATLELNLFGAAGGKFRGITSSAAAMPPTSTTSPSVTQDDEDPDIEEEN